MRLFSMRRSVPVFLAACLVPLGAGGASWPDKPNIVFILADDLGWSDVSEGATTYGGGSDFYETPNVARLAREGMAFTSAYTCPNCTPTRAALLSGQYPPRTRVYAVGHLNRRKGTPPLLGPAQHQDVPARLTTLGEMLQAAGYVTAHFGKYHVGGHEGGVSTLPEHQGYNFNFGGGSAGNPGRYWAREVSPGVWQFGNKIGPQLDRYAAPYQEAYRRRYRLWAQPHYTLPASLDGTPKHVGDALADAAMDFMERYRRQGRPFYVQFHQYLVHSPFQARPDLKAKYERKKRTHPSRMGHHHSTYAAMVEQFDQSVGRLLAYLNDPNGDGDPSDSIAAHTLVIFYSDNGGMGRVTSNRPLRGAKGMFFEGGIRVPLVVWMPGVIPHATNDTLITMVDFYKTLAELARAPLPDPAVQPLDGQSFAPLLLGHTRRLPRRAIYWHFPGYLDTRAEPCSTIIKDLAGKRYKLLYYYEDRSWSLYNLTDDLGEAHDLWRTVEGRSAYRSVAKNLSADLRRWLDEVGAIYPTVRKTGRPVPPPTPLGRQSLEGK